MSLFVIGDLHLSLGADKPMDVFRGWDNYVERLEKNWRAAVTPQDTVILAGDTSWGMSLEESREDFAFIQSLPGEKYILKGNHDYWWSTKNKMETFFASQGLSTLHILHNNALRMPQGVLVCASRGWLFEKGEAHDKKILAREALRLELSIQDALRQKQESDELVAFLHYPPLYGSERSQEILSVLKQYGVSRCYYGHLHSRACANAFQGEYEGTTYRLVSCDGLGFMPLCVCP